MADKETIEDIIAEMETERPGLMNGPINTNNLYYSRRLKAALERERGDAAKLREALEFIKLASDDYETYGNTKAGALDVIYEKACAALAEPPRNCDVGRAEEQYKRFMNMCNSKDVRQCAECSMRGFTLGCSRDRCFANWAQMPYEEGGAK